MSDTEKGRTPLWDARDFLGLSREAVTRRPEIAPAISTKTLERWEKGANVPRFRLMQLAAIYDVAVDDLLPTKAAA